MNKNLLSKLNNYFESKPIIKAWIFGSYARGEQTSESDIDILVKYEKGFRPGLFGISQIIEELELITGTKVDLVEDGFLFPRIAKEVESEKVMIYERNNP